ncbi:MAG: tRNA pseudouridine(55) synthase TruB [Candidatus Enterosoma sp.]
MKKVGFFFVDKPEGYTSKDCDSVIKRDFNLKKAGHLGTLDPFATGLLIVGVSDATKLFTLIDDEKKTYVATLELGVLTDTLDCTGTIIKKEEVQPLSLSKIQETLTSFLGNSTQEVPLYSAKHIDGVRAYQLAREGSKVKPPSIQIHISSIRLLSYQHPFLTFEAEDSKGT